MTDMTVVATGSDVHPATRSSLRIGHGAVLRAMAENTVEVEVPAMGTLRLPPPQTLAWLAGLTTLAVLEIVEWPVALAVGAGHVLAHQTHMKLLHDFGEALEKA
jgi:hypothetical protein